MNDEPKAPPDELGDGRPVCPACGAPWSAEMVNLLDLALGAGCACCNPGEAELPDVVCHACRKVLYTFQGESLPL